MATPIHLGSSPYPLKMGTSALSKELSRPCAFFPKRRRGKRLAPTSPSFGALAQWSARSSRKGKPSSEPPEEDPHTTCQQALGVCLVWACRETTMPPLRQGPEMEIQKPCYNITDIPLTPRYPEACWGAYPALSLVYSHIFCL